MAVLTSEVVRDETFERRRASMERLVAELRERTALVAAGGGEKAVERHRSSLFRMDVDPRELAWQQRPVRCDEAGLRGVQEGERDLDRQA